MSSKSIKTILLTVLLSGLLFAGFNAAYDYKEGAEFSLMRFAMHAVFFGMVIGLIRWYELRKKAKANEQEQTNEK